MVNCARERRDVAKKGMDRGDAIPKQPNVYEEIVKKGWEEYPKMGGPTNFKQLPNRVLSVLLAPTQSGLPSPACLEDSRIFSKSS